MIDPDNVIDFERSEPERHEFLLFAICVAGKTAKVVAPKVDALCKEVCDRAEEKRFFYALRDYDLKEIEKLCRKHKTGRYKIIPKGLYEIAVYLNNSIIPMEVLGPHSWEKFTGIGPKTSRYFTVYTKSHQRYAVLDRHILKWLKKEGYDVPDNTPSGKRYQEVEKMFLYECDRRHLPPHEFDLEIWREYSNGTS